MAGLLIQSPAGYFLCLECKFKKKNIDAIQDLISL